ncbi:hypothetical protein, partial [Anaplasma marginale]|uniref:hypothetical protein n=1 Tax=Anaplasma marginale TaxID=770 RepID=UPI0005B45496
MGRLDINGTFIGTTADGVRLGTNDVYSASDPASSSLLTIRPEALFVNRVRAIQRAIINQGNLQANPGSNLTLSADEINNNGSINVPSGNVFLEAVNGDINLTNIDTRDGINGGGDINISATGNINFNGIVDASGGEFILDPETFQTEIRSNSIANGGN